MAVALNCENGVQFFECGGNRIRKTPDRSRPEFLVLRRKAEITHGASGMLWSLESALDERLADNHFGGDVRQFSSLPRFHSTGLRIGSKFRCIRSTPPEMRSMMGGSITSFYGRPRTNTRPGQIYPRRSIPHSIPFVPAAKYCPWHQRILQPCRIHRPYHCFRP